VKLTLNLLGATMLWIGWFGFNGGSALAANAVASVALINTQVCHISMIVLWALPSNHAVAPGRQTNVPFWAPQH
jgi:ammonia channel protein AmtB